MIFSSNEDDGPTSSKRARLISDNLPGSSQDEHMNMQYRPHETRSIGHRRQIWDDPTDSDSPSSSGDAKGLPTNLKF